MFSDPQTITVNAVAKPMPRIENNGLRSVYQNADGSFKLTLSHVITKERIRTMIRIDQRAIATDPLNSVQDWQTLTDYHVIDRPIVGFSVAQIQQQVAANNLWLDSTAIAKLMGSES